jgi:hypothetical protein
MQRERQNYKTTYGTQTKVIYIFIFFECCYLEIYMYVVVARRCTILIPVFLRELPPNIWLGENACKHRKHHKRNHIYICYTAAVIVSSSVCVSVSVSHLVHGRRGHRVVHALSIVRVTVPLVGAHRDGRERRSMHLLALLVLLLLGKHLSLLSLSLSLSLVEGLSLSLLLSLGVRIAGRSNSQLGCSEPTVEC